MGIYCSTHIFGMGQTAKKWSPITVGSQNQHLMLGMNVPLLGWLSVSSEVSPQGILVVLVGFS